MQNHKQVSVRNVILIADAIVVVCLFFYLALNTVKKPAVVVQTQKEYTIEPLHVFDLKNYPPAELSLSDSRYMFQYILERFQIINGTHDYKFFTLKRLMELNKDGPNMTISHSVNTDGTEVEVLASLKKNWKDKKANLFMSDFNEWESLFGRFEEDTGNTFKSVSGSRDEILQKKLELRYEMLYQRPLVSQMIDLYNAEGDKSYLKKILSAVYDHYLNKTLLNAREDKNSLYLNYYYSLDSIQSERQFGLYDIYFDQANGLAHIGNTISVGNHDITLNAENNKSTDPTFYRLTNVPISNQDIEITYINNRKSPIQLSALKSQVNEDKKTTYIYDYAIPRDYQKAQYFFDYHMSATGSAHILLKNGEKVVNERDTADDASGADLQQSLYLDGSSNTLHLELTFDHILSAPEEKNDYFSFTPLQIPTMVLMKSHVQSGALLSTTSHTTDAAAVAFKWFALLLGLNALVFVLMICGKYLIRVCKHLVVILLPLFLLSISVDLFIARSRADLLIFIIAGMWIIVLVGTKIEYMINFYAALGLFILIFLFKLLGDISGADNTATFTYMFILIGFVHASLRKEGAVTVDSVLEKVQKNRIVKVVLKNLDPRKK